MKYLIIIFMFIGASSLFAQGKKTDEFKVGGACGMCEKRIEKEAMSIKGVFVADWVLKTNMLSVTYNEKKTSKSDIEKAIAKVGHDTENEKADDKVYNALPGCCKYR